MRNPSERSEKSRAPAKHTASGITHQEQEIEEAQQEKVPPRGKRKDQPREPGEEADLAPEDPGELMPKGRARDQ
jgi:hypothetical protein